MKLTSKTSTLTAMLICSSLFAAPNDSSREWAEVRVEKIDIPTCIFSDADPVPCVSESRYPYRRHDVFSASPTNRQWTSVVLENETVKMTILPEMGGRIWGAKEKSTGLDFIHAADTASFRDAAVRGPWCPGGLEFNFSPFEHSPSAVSSVDWCVHTNTDGSVSCFVSAPEFTGRTVWQVEVRLYPGADHFVTRSTWFNSSNLPCPQSQWSSATYSAKDDPRSFIPGRASLDAAGKIGEWPVGKDGRLSAVPTNSIPCTYDVLDGDSRIFAVWWPDAKFGSYHASAVYDKFGRSLRTNPADGCFTIESGRLFTQGKSTATPFAISAFAPGAIDTFDEKWGVTRDIAVLEAKSTISNYVSRPLKKPANFEDNSSYGLYLKGVQQLRMHADMEGEALLRKSLEAEPCFIPALNALAGLMVRRGRYAEARELAARALAVDSYDPEANYIDGLAAFALDDLETAKERLGLAAYSPLYRSPAMVMIAKARLRAGHWNEARATAERCLRGDPMNPDAHLARIASLRMTGDKKRAAASARLLLVQWPLNHIAEWELERLGVVGADFKGGIRGELPVETIIDVAGWYEEAGMSEDALAIFALAPDHPVSQIRAAHLLSRLGKESEAAERLAAAEALSVEGISPFRRESRAALMWAADANPSWKFKYLAAVHLASTGESSAADELLAKAGDPEDATFMLFRASRRTGSARLADLLAAKRAGGGWRVGRELALHHQSVGDFASMLAVTYECLATSPNVQSIKILQAKALLGAKHFKECIEYLEGLKLIPSPENVKLRHVWKKACVGEARAALSRGDVKACDAALEKRKLSRW